MMAEAYGNAPAAPASASSPRARRYQCSAGVYVAHQDSTPLILFVGQVERRFLDAMRCRN